MPGAEQLALWAAIRENPEDDLPRLVYADWLEEHGDEPGPRRVGGLVPVRRPNAARAEFIRIQCALAKLDANPRGEVAGSFGGRVLRKLVSGERQKRIDGVK